MPSYRNRSRSRRLSMLNRTAYRFIGTPRQVHDSMLNRPSLGESRSLQSESLFKLKASISKYYSKKIDEILHMVSVSGWTNHTYSLYMKIHEELEYFLRVPHLFSKDLIYTPYMKRLKEFNDAS